jgi:NAD-dependent DNA ligase
LEALIVSQGGTIASGVSKKTTHLVVKDVNGTSSKITKARSLGIPILTIDSFKQNI